MTEFDKTELYATELQPLIDRMKQICSDNNIPMFFAACTKSEQDKTTYEYELIGSKSQNIILKDDYIPKFLNVINGFDTVLKNEPLIMDFDTVDNKE